MSTGAPKKKGAMYKYILGILIVFSKKNFTKTSPYVFTKILELFKIKESSMRRGNLKPRNRNGSKSQSYLRVSSVKK